jgi:3-phosphoshikimate 1-carboxyvinyltransferase
VRLEEKDNELLWEGASTEEQKDSQLIFDTYEDHRMAMSLAPVCLRTGSQIRINNPEVVSKSYPAFWSDLEKAGFKICR